MTEAQRTEIVSRYVTQHAPTMGGPAAVTLGRAAAAEFANDAARTVGPAVLGISPLGDFDDNFYD